MCTTEPLYRVHGVLAGTPVPRLTILHALDLIELSGAAGRAAFRNRFAFLFCLPDGLPAGAQIEISFSTPHQWRAYETLSRNELAASFEWFRPIVESISLRPVENPNQWSARNQDVAQLPPHLPEAGQHDPLDYLKQTFATAAKSEAPSVDDAKLVLSPTEEEWKRDGEQDYPHHVVSIEGPREPGALVRAGIAAYHATTPYVGGWHPLDSGKAGLYYASPTMGRQAFERDHPWDGARSVPHLVLELAMLTPRKFSHFEPEIHEWAPGRDQLLGPDRRSYQEAKWAVVFGPFAREHDGVDELRSTRWEVEIPKKWSKKETEQRKARLALFLIEREQRVFTVREACDVSGIDAAHWSTELAGLARSIARGTELTNQEASDFLLSKEKRLGVDKEWQLRVASDARALLERFARAYLP